MWAFIATAWNALPLGFRGLPWKWIGVGVGALALIASAYFGYLRIVSTYTAADERGYARGVNEWKAKAEAANAEVARLNAAKAAEWSKAGSDAVAAYIADQAKRAPAVEAVTKERIVYVHDKANAVPCVDAVGVGLLARNRAANGIPASAPAAPAAR